MVYCKSMAQMEQKKGIMRKRGNRVSEWFKKCFFSIFHKTSKFQNHSIFDAIKIYLGQDLKYTQFLLLYNLHLIFV
jgi:hypothetical protein